ncbi:MAG: serine hydrolase [Proteobacteria bacterium]|nr:serine hydrolase [Pseudomonadota bacterium]
MNRNRIKTLAMAVALTAVLVLTSPARTQAGIRERDNAPQPSTYAIDSLPDIGTSPYTLDEKKLDELVSAIRADDFGKTDSLVIIQNDSLILEKYFRGWARDRRHSCFSVTKSVTSALIGILLDRGEIPGLDEKLLSFFPGYQNIKNMDARKEAITLEHVLTMTAGFSWNEVSTPYFFGIFPNLKNEMTRMLFSRDYIKYVLDKSMAADPGTVWTYNSGSLDLLSGIITDATGQTAEDFAAENLFHPIGITDWKWNKGSQGISETGAGLSLHPVDMAMFGYLFLKKGRLQGKQIVPEEWVAVSTAQHVAELKINDQAVNLHYGYLWWIMPVNATIGGSLQLDEIYCALGYGGQCIFVIPPLDMVVVSTASNFDSAARLFSGFKFLTDYILPAVKER